MAQFMLDLHTGEHGYMEVNPPILVRDEAMFGTAQLPKFRDDQFRTTTQSMSTISLSKACEPSSMSSSSLIRSNLKIDRKQLCEILNDS